MKKIKKSGWRSAKDAEKVIAKEGVSSRLVFLSSILISFLAIYALTLSSIATQISNNWEKSISESATFRIPVEVIRENTQIVAENLLETTKGVVSFEEIPFESQVNLLSPWLGDEIPQEVLKLPMLYSIVIDPENFDEDAFTLRAQGEIPGSIWDNHQRWRARLLDSANRLSLTSWTSSFIIAVVYAFLIFLSATASIYSNASKIILLRQIGARDRWILNGFLRKFVVHSVMGAIIGVLIGLLAMYGIVNSNASAAQIFETNVVRDTSIIIAAIIIISAGIVGYISTYFTTSKYLNKVT